MLAAPTTEIAVVPTRLIPVGGEADRSLPPPNVPTISNTADYSNFDTYSLDSEVPADDYSDWSKDF